MPLPSTEMVTVFAALADQTRLRLLNLMDGREVCVCYFVEILKQSQPKISRHLAYMRRAGIVNARREGKWMYYSIRKPNDSVTSALLEAAIASLREDQQMRRDLLKLNVACCNPKKFVRLIGAPQPLEINA